jgi:hypothetical protein
MCGISLGAVEVQRIIHYTFVSGDSIVLHAHAAGALEMFLASRLYMYLQVYHHRTGRRFDLSMREVFADTIAQLLHGNPLEHLDEYEQLNDWSMLVAVQRWLRDPPGSATCHGTSPMKVSSTWGWTRRRSRSGSTSSSRRRRWARGSKSTSPSHASHRRTR